MYLLKHIRIGVNSVINQLIVALVPVTSACLSSFTPGASITAENGFTNSNTNRHLALLCRCIPNGANAKNVL
jgi:hypothetical protein